jgi:hypothetical protein
MDPVLPGSPVPEEERARIRVEEKIQEGGLEAKRSTGKLGKKGSLAELRDKGGKDESHKRVAVILDVMMLATDNDQALELVIDAIVPLYVLFFSKRGFNTRKKIWKNFKQDFLLELQGPIFFLILTIF